MRPSDATRLGQQWQLTWALAHCTDSHCRIRGNGEVIRREEFEQRKEASEQARQARLNKKPKKLASQGKHVDEFPLLQVGAGFCYWTVNFLQVFSVGVQAGSQHGDSAVHCERWRGNGQRLVSGWQGMAGAGAQR